MTHDHQRQAVVVGAGPAGLAAALALAQVGLRVTVTGTPPPRSDNRTAALWSASVELLRNLSAWDELAGVAEPLTAIRVVDDMGALLRAPEVLFTAAEVGLDALGYNVPNVALVAALRRRAAASATITLIDTPVASLEIGAAQADVRLADGTSIAAALVVGADGRNSLCRAAAGIAARTWTYDQNAITCTFTHQRPHEGVSTEFHRPGGPLTVVPSPGRSSSLVWVERPAIARRLAGLDEAAFRAALETRLQGLLGPVGDIGARATFPLSGLTAAVAGANRVALAGEALHVIPPIGAQGLNLGLRDAATLADCVHDALHTGHDIGGAVTLAAYARARRSDVTSRTWSIDLLNRSLLSDLPPVQLARGAGLFALKAIAPLRRLAIREGLAPSFITPRLMRAPGPAEERPLDGRGSPLSFGAGPAAELPQP